MTWDSERPQGVAGATSLGPSPSTPPLRCAELTRLLPVTADGVECVEALHCARSPIHGASRGPFASYEALRSAPRDATRTPPARTSRWHFADTRPVSPLSRQPQRRRNPMPAG